MVKKILLSCFALIALVGCRVGQPTRNYSDGWRVARVEKISHKGFMWTTWEGRAILEGYNKDEHGNIIVRTFEFSVMEQDALGLVPQLQAAMDSGKPVRLHYRQDWMVQMHYDTNYFIDKVEATK